MTLRNLRHAAWPLLLTMICQAAGAMQVDSTSPPFIASQAAAGRLVYARACGICHGANLQGGAAVALAGSAFAKTWGDGRHQGMDFFDAIAKQMPKNAPGSLSAADNLALTAFILGSNGYAAGAEPLTVAGLAGTLPVSAQASAAAAAVPAAPSGPPAVFPQPPPTVLPASGSAPQDAQLLHVPDADWLTYNRTLAGDRYSPLAQINAGNAHRLQVKCIAQLGEMGSFETSPIVLDGQMFVTTAHKVLALDAATCAVRWSYNYVPVDPEHLPGNRGVALYAGRVFRGTTDGHLLALDAATGKLSWYVQQVPHDMHDWDTAAAPALFSRGGLSVMAVASKNGLLYQYDRDSHRTLSQTPFTTRANMEALPSAAGVHVCPGALGQYNGPAFSPLAGLVFVAAADRCNVLTRAEPHYVPGGVYFGGMFRMDPPALQSGWIKAFDAISGHEVWSVHRKDPVLAAVTPTAGGLLLTGDMGGSFLALDARDGRVLYEFATGGPVAAGISVYAVAGGEYIAVPSGSSSRDAASATAAATLIIFSLQ